MPLAVISVTPVSDPVRQPEPENGLLHDLAGVVQKGFRGMPCKPMNNKHRNSAVQVVSRVKVLSSLPATSDCRNFNDNRNPRL